MVVTDLDRQGLLSIEQNCGILTNNTCKKSIFHVYHL